MENVTYYKSIEREFSTDHFLLQDLSICYFCSCVRASGMKNDDVITYSPSKMKLFIQVMTCYISIER